MGVKYTGLFLNQLPGAVVSHRLKSLCAVTSVPWRPSSPRYLL